MSTGNQGGAEQDTQTYDAVVEKLSTFDPESPDVLPPTIRCKSFTMTRPRTTTQPKMPIGRTGRASHPEEGRRQMLEKKLELSVGHQ